MKRRPTWWTRLALAVLGLIVAAPMAGAGSLKTYRDPVHKFSLKVPADWSQVPIEPTEVVQVAKFFEDSSRGDYFQTEMTVYRIPRGKAAEGPVTGIDLSKIPEEMRAQILAQLKNDKEAYDYTFPYLINPLNVELPDREKGFKKVRSSDKVDGRYYLALVPHRENDKGATVMAMLGVFEKDDIQYGVYMTTTQRRGEKLERDFKSIMKSFLFFDENAKDVRERDELDDLVISPKRRRKIEEGLIKGWDLEVSPDKNYLIIYNTKNGKNKALAKEIGKRIEAIRAQIYEKQFPPATQIEAVSVVRVCADEKEYRAYGGRPGSAGYWYWPAEELVFYDASAGKKIDDDTVSVLYHEAFHQFIYYSVGQLAPHSWFNEGHGDYYAGAVSKGRSFKIEPFDWRVQTIKDAVREGRRSFTVKTDKSGREHKVWSKGGYAPIEDILAFPQSQYYDQNIGINYAQGWSIVYFLREGLNSSQRAKWGNVLDVYFDTLKAEVNPKPKAEDEGDDEGDGDEEGDDETEESDEPPAEVDQFGAEDENALQKALRVAFEGVDMAEFEEAWAKFVSGI